MIKFIDEFIDLIDEVSEKEEAAKYMGYIGRFTIMKMLFQSLCFPFYI